MTSVEELRVLRRRIDDLRSRLDALTARIETGSAAILVQVVAETSLPTAAKSFFAFVPVDPSGIEGEGKIPTLTARSHPGRLDYAANVGATAPAAGSFFVVDRIDRYWILRNG